jgi:hypothetical protein
MLSKQRQNEILAGLCAKIRMVQALGFTPRLVYRPTSSEKARMLKTVGSYPVKQKIGFNILARMMRKGA